MAQKEIIEVITAYLKRANDKTAYALLLNGEWGAGKTYYFKNTVQKDIKKASNRKIIYVSLNGVKSSSEIEKQLISELLRNRFSIPLVAWRVLDYLMVFIVAIIIFFCYQAAQYVWLFLGATFLAGWKYISNHAIGKFMLTKITFDIRDYRTFLSTLFGKQYCFCFDDLERCTMPIKEVLGYINTHLIENSQPQKVIIIADETQIEVKQKDDYKPIKEKLIGRTIEFKPSQKDILDTILTNPKLSLLNAYRIFIDEKLEYIGDNKVWNLRTLFFAFENLETVLKYLDADYINQLNDLNAEYNLFHQLIYYVLAVSYEYKHSIDEHYKYLKMSAYDANKNRIFKEMQEKNLAKRQELKYENSYQHNSFPSEEIKQLIFDFVEKGIFQEAEFKTLLDEHLAQEKSRFVSVEFNKLYDSYCDTIIYPVSELQVQKAAKYLIEMLSYPLIKERWLEPVVFLSDMQKIQRNNLFSSDFLEELCQDKGADFVNWLLQQHYFDELNELLDEEFINERALEFSNGVTFREFDEQVEFWGRHQNLSKIWVSLRGFSSDLLQSNLYLSRVNSIFNKIRTKDIKIPPPTDIDVKKALLDGSLNWDSIENDVLLERGIISLLTKEPEDRDYSEWGHFIKNCSGLNNNGNSKAIDILLTSLKKLKNERTDRVERYNLQRALDALNNNPDQP